MIRYFTLREFLDRLSAYLAGHTDFSAVGNWILDYYVTEEEKVLDEPMEAIHRILAGYCEWVEAVGDPQCRVRMERLYRLLSSATKDFAERAVFALKFDEIKRWVNKFRGGFITREVYERKLGSLAADDYDVQRIMEWGEAHVDYDEPVEELLR